MRPDVCGTNPVGASAEEKITILSSRRIAVRGGENKITRKRGFMGKALFIAEKPSVAQEFAKALKVSGRKGDGYIESGSGDRDLVCRTSETMSYPDAYDPALKRWSMETLPFLPENIQIPGDRRCEETIYDRERALKPGGRGHDLCLH